MSVFFKVMASIRIVEIFAIHLLFLVKSKFCAKYTRLLQYIESIVLPKPPIQLNILKSNAYKSIFIENNQNSSSPTDYCQIDAKKVWLVRDVNGLISNKYISGFKITEINNIFNAQFLYGLTKLISSLKPANNTFMLTLF